jgi:hypothetical protein
MAQHSHNDWIVSQLAKGKGWADFSAFTLAHGMEYSLDETTYKLPK